MMQQLTPERLVEHLRKVATKPTQSAWAQEHGVDGASLSRTLAGVIEPPPKLLDAIGFERVITYRRKATK